MLRSDLRVLFVTALAFAASTARGGVIHGDLVAARTGARTTRAADSVVWLESVPEKVEQRLASGRRGLFRKRVPPPPVGVMSEAGLRFEPSVVAIAVGTPLEIRNHDSVWHGAFSVSKAGAFELGKRAPGSVDTVRFTVPGVVALRCDIHPEMSATVVVTPNHAFARPDADGHWRLPDVPSGTYVVHAWRPNANEIRREVRMPAHGDTLVTLRW